MSQSNSVLLLNTTCDRCAAVVLVADYCKLDRCVAGTTLTDTIDHSGSAL